jgi:CelD/BcsL family acetyltransferase involved in cellulose biosynthesis
MPADAVPAGPLTMFALEDPRWLDFVRSVPGASFFHHPAWARLVADCYSFAAMAAAVTDSSGRITAGLPLVDVRGPLGRRRWVALPFTDHCPAVGDSREHGRLAAAIVAEGRRRGVAGVEIRAALPPAAGLASTVAAVRHVLDLTTDPGDVLAGLSPMHRRNIRKALRASVEIARGTSEADVAVFYDLHLRTRRRHGVPVQPRRFFRLLHRHVIDAGHGFVLTASLGGAAVAAAVFLAWNGTLIYKYGASDERSWEHRPNNLLLWSAIAWGCENGFRAFDLGRSDLEDSGLRSFKDGFGAREEPLVHSGTAPLERARARPIVEWALAAMIRRAHPWLSRAVGELFYRYAA